MNPIFNIQTEIQVSDILELLNAGETRHFICHNIAYLIQDKLALIPGYEKFQNLSRFRSKGLHSLPYYFILYDVNGRSRYVPKKYDLSYQVVEQLNSIHCQITKEHVYPSGEVLNNGLLETYCKRDGSSYSHWSRIARIQFLRAIVKFNPQAVLSINI